ncbi:hypothetical protein VOLCADRAFT_100472 [Volvox carteri f. nagariensis]|uniref:Uncharacterized protein n=1 Tax=Volvox carteri f. nagariensis TaxID=3068 RepID=D8UKA0_VOLCA|nr:uncharacterized protein VOLCADRAFT_100472 [Volvox carteri f. nagariensis]EFJ39846.1 hypothetical protein VOLCADRAFT_100472 [Volvox carteri f. nagariensis]|eukprot:XP_002959083.1 hypothetical protein VOLCADRAFT_100472 [Volvox carteri f. nagariensis]
MPALNGGLAAQRHACRAGCILCTCGFDSHTSWRRPSHLHWFACVEAAAPARLPVGAVLRRILCFIDNDGPNNTRTRCTSATGSTFRPPQLHVPTTDVVPVHRPAAYTAVLAAADRATMQAPRLLPFTMRLTVSCAATYGVPSIDVTARLSVRNAYCLKQLWPVEQVLRWVLCLIDNEGPNNTRTRRTSATGSTFRPPQLHVATTDVVPVHRPAAYAALLAAADRATMQAMRLLPFTMHSTVPFANTSGTTDLTVRPSIRNASCLQRLYCVWQNDWTAGCTVPDAAGDCI